MKEEKKMEERTHRICASNSLFQFVCGWKNCGRGIWSGRNSLTLVSLQAVICGGERAEGRRYREKDQLLSSNSCKGKVRCIDRPHTMKRQASIECGSKSWRILWRCCKEEKKRARGRERERERERESKQINKDKPRLMAVQEKVWGWHCHYSQEYLPQFLLTSSPFRNSSSCPWV